MSVLVYHDENFYGRLSLYTGLGERFRADDVAVPKAIATHLAVVMTSSREIDQLEVAPRNRLVIGGAEGIIMERLGVTGEQSFD